MPLQMPHVSVCDSHNSLPQSEHCVLAVLEQGSPSSSAEFLTSMTSQLFGMEEVYCSYHKWQRSEPGRERNGDVSPTISSVRLFLSRTTAIPKQKHLFLLFLYEHL